MDSIGQFAKKMEFDWFFPSGDPTDISPAVKRFTPEEDLWYSVLTASLEDVGLSLSEGKGKRQKHNWREAVSWFLYQGEDYIGSFDYVTSLFDLDPGRILSVVKELRCSKCGRRNIDHYPCKNKTDSRNNGARGYKLKIRTDNNKTL